VQTLKTELKLPNQASVLPLGRSFVRELAALAELAPKQGEALELAVDEACANVMKHAFGPGESGAYTLFGEVTAAALQISIRDQGLPFDPALATAGAGHGKGLARIRHAVDEAHWICHGKDGKELRLIKLRPHRHVTAHLSEAELASIAADAPPAPPQDYVIRRFQADDALGVAQCVYRVYGYSYPNEALYYPDRLARLNQTGEQIAVVAVDEGGAIVGHYALERSGFDRVAESGEAVVSPPHRGRRLMERMRALLEEEGRAAGLVGVFGEATTNHVFSQRSDETVGCRVCGIVFGEWPASVTFKQIQPGLQPQRLSYVVYFKFLQRPPTVVAHLPLRHRDVIRRIYAGLDLEVEYRSGSGPEGEGLLSVEYQTASSSGYIRVHRAGADSAAEIHRALRDLCDVSGAEAVYLDLPLADSGTPAICEAAEGAGFFFGGIGPQLASEGDTLRLQYVAHDLDPSRMQLVNPFARELADYAARDRKRSRISRHAK
jgi:anti-sigma regulatory factor (Ser/Thr protein kinase)